MDKRVKIDNLTEDTVVLGGRTLKEVVALMDRLRGMFYVVDVSPDAEHRKAFCKKRSHFYANTPDKLQWTMQHLTYDHVHVPKHPNGLFSGYSIWDMYIAHDVMPHGHQAKRGKQITLANLNEAISRIAYVITPERDVTADVDRAEEVLATYEARLGKIGEWVRSRLYMDAICECGHQKIFKAHEVFRGIPGDRETSDVVKRLKCTKCGSASLAEINPLNRRGFYPGLGPFAYDHNDFIDWGNPKPSRKPREAEPRKYAREDPFYVDLGGNGQDPVYVGDDVYMDPDGRLRDY